MWGNGWLSNAVDAARDRLRAGWWLLMALALGAWIAMAEPQQIGYLGWAICKLAAGAWLGYWLDRTLFPGARPLDLTDAMAADRARMRRAIVVVGSMVSLSLTV